MKTNNKELQKVILDKINNNAWVRYGNGAIQLRYPETLAKEMAEWMEDLVASQFAPSKEYLRKELLKFNSWMCGKQYDGRIPLIGTCIDEYLKSELCEQPETVAYNIGVQEYNVKEQPEKPSDIDIQKWAKNKYVNLNSQVIAIQGAKAMRDGKIK